MANLEYPIEAMLKNIQGEARIDVLIGADGKVLATTGSGSNAILVAAAEQNARQWVFGPFNAHVQFPIEHRMTYKFALQGKAKYIGIQPKIITELPDRIEIIANPMASDGPVLIQVKPTAKDDIQEGNR